MFAHVGPADAASGSHMADRRRPIAWRGGAVKKRRRPSSPNCESRADACRWTVPKQEWISVSRSPCHERLGFCDQLRCGAFERGGELEHCLKAGLLPTRLKP